MPLVTSNQFKLTPDVSNIGTGFLQGLDVGNRIKQQKIANQFRTDEQQLAQSNNQFNQDLQVAKLQSSQQQAAGKLASTDKKLNLDERKFQAEQDQRALENQLAEDIRENDALTQIAISASDFKGSPNEMRSFLKSESLRLKEEGRDTTNIDNTINLPDDAMVQKVDQQARQGQSISDQAKNKFEVPKLTTLQQNLMAAGLKPGTPEFAQETLNSIRKSGININTGEAGEEKELAKNRVKKLAELQDRADSAQGVLDAVSQLENIDVNTGALEQGKVAIASILEGFGVDASSIANVTNAQAFESVSERLLNDVLSAATGPQTDADADRVRKTLASIKDTPGAVGFKNNSLKSMALRQVEQRDFIENQLDEGSNLTKANKAWREFKKKTPMVNSALKGPDGLPVFFFQFKENAEKARPGISSDEIIKAWRGIK